MKFLDLIKPLRGTKQLVLEASNQSQWLPLIAEHIDATEIFHKFVEEYTAITKKIEHSLLAFSNEGILSAIPDRARTMNVLHGNEYALQVKKLLQATKFSDLWHFEAEQSVFFEAMSGHKDLVAKNISVLKEFMSDELKSTQQQLQELEDLVINCSKQLDEKKFPVARKVKELIERLSQIDGKREKYQKLLTSLEQDLKRTKEKYQDIEQAINDQIGLIRNQESLQALDRLGKIETELHSIHTKYTNVANDIKLLCKKNPSLRLDNTARLTIEELHKQASHFLMAHPDEIATSFATIIEQLEEERVNGAKQIIEQLAVLGPAAAADARTLQTATPDLRQLKRSVIKDVAALQVYDKRQFLLRAKTEQESIEGKIAFLTKELDPSKKTEIERELKDTASQIGVTVQLQEQQ